MIGHFISKTAICRREGQKGPLPFQTQFWRECWVDVGIHWFVLNSRNQRIYNLNTWPPASNRPGSSWLPRVMTMQSGSSMKKAKSSRKISQAFGPKGRMFNVAWRLQIQDGRLQNSSFRCILGPVGQGSIFSQLCWVHVHVGNTICQMHVFTFTAAVAPRSAISPLKMYLAHLESLGDSFKK